GLEGQSPFSQRRDFGRSAIEPRAEIVRHDSACSQFALETENVALFRCDFTHQFVGPGFESDETGGLPAKIGAVARARILQAGDAPFETVLFERMLGAQQIAL